VPIQRHGILSLNGYHPSGDGDRGTPQCHAIGCDLDSSLQHGKLRLERADLLLKKAHLLFDGGLRTSGSAGGSSC
jgi:hypothetical protein